jgi:hypothetical protein
MQEFPPLCGLRFVRSLLLLGNLKLDLLPFFFFKLLLVNDKQFLFGWKLESFQPNKLIYLD